MTSKTAIKKLKEISENTNETDLKREVAKMVIDELEGYEKADGFFNDLFSNGCVSGMIGGLIYYTDTYNFFDTHYNDIMDLVDELNNEGIGVDLMKDNNVKNTGAWLAFEETSRQLASELGIEI